MKQLLILSVVLSTCITAIADGAQSKPNVVVFIADDHGYLDSSVAGAKEFQTPNFERLARDGMTLTHAFAASPSCAPSRAAFLTGLMPMRNGAMLNHQPPRADVKKLPDYLRELGYEVVAIGKVAHYEQGRQYGFDYTSHDKFHDDQCVEAAVDFLRQRESTKPLCLLVGTNWPHVPWPKAGAIVTKDLDNTNRFQPPPTHVDTADTRRWRLRYAAAVERCDHDLGLVYEEAYKRLGSNTLFIQFSDHGAQWPFGKWNLYDAGIRTELFAVWPGKIKPGSKSGALVSLVDLIPTLIAAAGGTPPKDIDGRSFLPVLTGDRPDFREQIFTTHSGDGEMNTYPVRSVRTKRWKYIRNLEPEGEHHTHIDLGKAVDGNGYWPSWVEQASTDKDAAAIVDRYYHRPAEELYDLEADPYEQRNLAAGAEYSGTLKELRAELAKLMEGQGDQGVASEKIAKKAFPKAVPKTITDQVK